MRKLTRIELADSFLLSALRKGLAHSYDSEKDLWVKPYPEVTGYLLSYFSKYYPDIPAQIISAANRLCNIQHKKGGFYTFFSNQYLYTFDTAQIMHGIASLYKKINDRKFYKTAMKCSKFIIDMQIDNGAMFPVYNTKTNAKYVSKKSTWGGGFSCIQTKNIEGLLLIYELTGDSKYLKSAERLKDFGKKHCDLTFSHPGAYCLEGLLAMGESNFVCNKLRDEIEPKIHPNGFLPYSEGLSYAYVSGSIQMGILLFKVGQKAQAHSILEWAKKVQMNHNTGGLFQYANADGSINQDVHTEINTWGTKYYAELERLFEEN